MLPKIEKHISGYTIGSSRIHTVPVQTLSPKKSLTCTTLLPKGVGRTSAACIFVRIPRNLTRSSITPRSGKGGSAALPPGTAGRAFVWRGILGVSGGGYEK